MTKQFSRCPKIALLASFLAFSFLPGFAETQSAQTKTSASKPVVMAEAKGAPANEAAVLSTPKDKLSYAIGADLGEKLKAQAIELDPAVFLLGLEDVLAGHKTALSDDEIRAALTDLTNQLRQKHMVVLKEEAEKNRKAGEAFLAENKTKQGVVATPSGLQYRILTAGEGKRPTAADTVTCNYRGSLIDGKEFDSSYKRGTPASFPVGGVIKGFSEALQLMPVGSKWELFLPSDLAYGERGAGQLIEPNSTLVFEVELLSIQEQAIQGKN
jgi:FKBP-type peptidyl-prolyl cis-trans isomerase FklB